MKIALVSPYDYPYAGGVQEHIAHAAKKFQERGHEVKVIAPSSTDDEELEEGVIRASSVIIPLPASGSVARIGFSPRMYRRVKKTLQRESFDVIHLHEPFHPLPMIVLRHSQALNVGTFHAYRKSMRVYTYAKPIFKRAIEKLDGKIAVSPAARELVARYFPGEYRLIPNGIDLERFAGAHVQPIERYCDGKLNILFVGRLEKRKGFRYLLEAFGYVKAKKPEARLIVVGAYSKEDKEPFVVYARRHNVHAVHFVGYVSPEALPRYYKTCDIFCAPSTGFESFGMVLLEAMAAGKPIVASDIAGYRHVLEGGEEGILVPPENPQALASTILGLLENPARREEMGKQGQAKAARYSWDVVADRLLDYYQELLGQPRRRTD